MITLTEIENAHERIRKFVFRTPCYPNLYFSRKSDAEIFLKLECYQPTGVFKIRGAFNIELENLERIKSTGVITASSGNHGFSVAYASKALGVDCTVVVTKGANPDKLKMIELHGAKIVEDGPTSDSIINKARELAKERDLFFISPFDDPSIIAGQGTCGLEILEDVSALDTVLVPVGGGGLISGVSTAFKATSPNCKVIGVEAIGVPSLYESMRKKKLVTIEHPTTIADGLIGQTIGRMNFEICERNVDGVVLVSDDQMREAVKSLLLDAHILAEPSGAAPVAALLSGAYIPRPKERVALVISGGNIAYSLLQELLNEAFSSRNRKS
ncbi:MAG: threonine/serine dehydratase [Nitrososphaerota archaeon]|nr:threonine/serine dehydratase [Nitrososphaerota archaeon]MDG6922284.1 threonine/serine dehydratase [Nitrososphaerota archaeon]